MAISQDDLKRRVASRAVDYVQPEMTIGLGTGSTAKYMIELLGEKVRSGLYITGIPTSEESRKLALENGLDIIEPDETTQIDLAIDGADEIDRNGNLIKGGGAALFREKIIAHSASQFIVIADGSKNVDVLGTFPLPLEIDPFCWPLTIQALRKTLTTQGFAHANVALRGGPNGPIHSDGGHLIVDCHLERIADPNGLHHSLLDIPGIIETGLFIHMADRIIIGGSDGQITEITPV